MKNRINPQSISYLFFLRYTEGRWIKQSCPKTSDTRLINPQLPKMMHDPHFINPVDNISLITFNVLFDNSVRSNFIDPTFHAKERFQHTIEDLQKADATIICLQEVTRRFADILLQQSFIQKNYYVSDFMENETLNPYGQLIISKLPFEKLRSYQFGKNSVKKCLIADFGIRNRILSVFNVHLPADKVPVTENEDIPNKQRSGQLGRILWLVNCVDSHEQLLCGDFNFGDDSEVENEFLYSSSMKDCWLEAPFNDDEPGYTANRYENSLTQVLCPEIPPVRLDRILLKSFEFLSPYKSCLVMNEGFLAYETNVIDGKEVREEKKYFESDHFGVKVCFKVLQN